MIGRRPVEAPRGGLRSDRFGKPALLAEVVMFARCLIGAGAILFSALVIAPAPAREGLHYHGALRAACGKEINSQCKGARGA